MENNSRPPQKTSFPCDSGYSDAAQQVFYSEQLNNISNVAYDPLHMHANDDQQNSFNYNTKLLNMHNLNNFDSSMYLQTNANLEYHNIQNDSYLGNVYSSKIQNLYNSELSYQPNPDAFENMNCIGNSLNEANSEVVNFKPIQDAQNQNHVYQNINLDMNNLQFVEHEPNIIEGNNLDVNQFSQLKSLPVDEEVAHLLHSMPSKSLILKSNQQKRNSTPCASLLPETNLSLQFGTLLIAPPLDTVLLHPENSEANTDIKCISNETQNYKVKDYGTGPSSVKEFNDSRKVLDNDNYVIYSTNSIETGKNIKHLPNNDVLIKNTFPLKQNLHDAKRNLHGVNSQLEIQTAGSNSVISNNNSMMPEFKTNYSGHQILPDNYNSGGVFMPPDRLSSNRIVSNKDSIIHDKLILDNSMQSNEINISQTSESTLNLLNEYNINASKLNDFNNKLINSKHNIDDKQKDNMPYINISNDPSILIQLSTQNNNCEENIVSKMFVENTVNSQTFEHLNNDIQLTASALVNDQNCDQYIEKNENKIQNIFQSNIQPIEGNLIKENLLESNGNLFPNIAQIGNKTPSVLNNLKHTNDSNYISKEINEQAFSINQFNSPELSTMSSNIIEINHSSQSNHNLLIANENFNIDSKADLSDQPLVEKQTLFKIPKNSTFKLPENKFIELENSENKIDNGEKYDNLKVTNLNKVERDDLRTNDSRSKHDEPEDLQHSKSNRYENIKREDKKNDRADEKFRSKDRDDKYQHDKVRSKKDEKRIYKDDDEHQRKKENERKEYDRRKKDDDYKNSSRDGDYYKNYSSRFRERSSDRKEYRDERERSSDRRYRNDREASSDRRVLDSNSKHKHESKSNFRDKERDDYDKYNSKYNDQKRDRSIDRDVEKRHDRRKNDDTRYDHRRDKSFDKNDPRRSRGNHDIIERPRSRHDQRIYKRDDYRIIGYDDPYINTAKMYYDDYNDYYYTQGRYQENSFQHPYYDKIYKGGQIYPEGFYAEMQNYNPQLIDPRYPYTQQIPPLSASSSSSDILTAADRFVQNSGPNSGRSSVVSVTYGLEPDQSKSRQFLSYDSQQPLREERLTPHFYGRPHLKISFTGPIGMLTYVRPNIYMNRQPPVFICKFDQEKDVEEFYRFPGPLIRGETHKNEVQDYCQQMFNNYNINEKTPSITDAQLIWKYLILLIQQNGSVTGTDTTELIFDKLKISKFQPNAVQSTCEIDTNLHEQDTRPSSGMSVSSERKNCDIVESSITNPESNLAKYTDTFSMYLLYGRKKEALDFAMKMKLWGHALFLSSKMDQKTYANVMLKFTNSMHQDDPLLTLYNMMSGKLPPAVASLSDNNWGTWKKHLCMIISNPTQKPDNDHRSIITLGDSLASRGLLHASHFCYMIANVPFGDFKKKSSKMVLIGSNHNESDFNSFASNICIQCTWVFEYAMQLENTNFYIPNLMTYKIKYIANMIDNGLQDECLKYLECLARDILLRGCPLSHARIVTLLAQNLIDRDPQCIITGATEQEPQWFKDLKFKLKSFEDGQYLSGHVTPFGGDTIHDGLGFSANVSFSSMNQHDSNLHLKSEQMNLINQPYPNLHNDTGIFAYTTGTDGLQSITSQNSYEQFRPNNFSIDQPEGIYLTKQQSENEPVTLNSSIDQSKTNDSSLNHQFMNQQLLLSQPLEHNLMKADYKATSLYDYQEDNGRQQMSEFYNPGSQIQDHIEHLNPENDDEISHLVSLPSNKLSRTRRDSKMSDESSSSPPDSPRLQTSRRVRYPGEDSEDEENRRKMQENKSKNVLQQNKNEISVSSGGSWLSKLNIFGGKSGPKPKEMILPDDKKPAVIFDKVKNKWIDTSNENANNEKQIDLPPPKMLDAAPVIDEYNNRFSREKIRGARGQYVDVFGSKATKSPPSSIDTNIMLPKSASVPANIFVPSTNSNAETVDSKTAVQENQIRNNEAENMDSIGSQNQNIDPLMFNPATFQPQASLLPNLSNHNYMRYRRPH